MQPIAEDPELTQCQGDRDVHVGKDDLDVGAVDQGIGDRGVQDFEFHRVACWRPGQGTSGLIYVANSNGRNKVADAKEELNEMIEDEMRDAVVLAFANTLTPSIATRSGKRLTDVGKNEDLWWWCADGAGGDSAVT